MIPAGFSPDYVGVFALVVGIMVILAAIGMIWGRHDTYN
jgi:preprotein translocase subunit Sec61beta